MNKFKQVKENIPYIIMVIPALAIFLLFFILPLLFTARYSFYYWTNYSPDITFLGFENYKRLFADGQLIKGISNTLKYSIINVLLQNMIALPVSVLLNTKLRGRNIYRTIFFCPAVLSTLVVGYLWKFLLSASEYGFVNQIINKLGFETINFLGNGKLALTMIIIIAVWQWFGWAMVIYLGNLQSISNDLYEAASVDGAGTLRRFWHITIPGLSPAIKINIVTGMISGLKVFDIVIATTNGGPAHQTETILTLMFSKFSEGNYGYASAFGIVFLIVSMLFSFILLGIFKRWEVRLDEE